MRHIMVLNSKGGCGKSTIATSLASYYATQDQKVALVDYDEQASALDWLARRPENRPPITGVAGFEDGLKHVPRSADVVIIDAPARSHGQTADLDSRRDGGRTGPAVDHRHQSHRDSSTSWRWARWKHKAVKLAVVANRSGIR